MSQVHSRGRKSCRTCEKIIKTPHRWLNLVHSIIPSKNNQIYNGTSWTTEAWHHDDVKSNINFPFLRSNARRDFKIINKANLVASFSKFAQLSFFWFNDLNYKLLREPNFEPGAFEFAPPAREPIFEPTLESISCLEFTMLGFKLSPPSVPKN